MVKGHWLQVTVTKLGQTSQSVFLVITQEFILLSTSGHLESFSFLLHSVYKLHVHITVTEKYDPTGILQLWVNEHSNWVYSSGLYAYPKGIQIPVPAGPGRHRYCTFPVKGECKREQFCLQTQQQTVVTPRRTKQGMITCQNFCFQRFVSVKLRI